MKNVTKFPAASFKRALDLVSPAVARVSTVVALTHVHVRMAALQASNNNMQITAPVDGSGAAIDVCIPLDRLQTAVAVASEEISIEQDGSFCVVKAGRHRFRVPILPGDQFIPLEATEPDVKIETTSKLHDALGRVAFCASKKDHRYYLTGIYVDCVDGVINATASDGGAMASMVAGEHGKPFGTILHRPTVDILVKAAPGEMAISQTMIDFQNEEMRLIAKSIEGQYPQWRRVIGDGKPLPYSITVSLPELLESVSLSKIMREKKARAIKMVTDKDALCIQAIGGLADERIDTEILITEQKGDDIKTAFNGEVLEPLLRALSGDTVTMSCMTPDDKSAMFMRDGDFRSVIMPWRL